MLTPHPTPPLRLDARRRQPVPRAPPPRRWKPIPRPIALEATYTEALTALLRRAWARIEAALKPVLAEADADEREDAAHTDAKPKKRKAAVTFEVVIEDLPEKVEEPFSLESVAPVAQKVAKSGEANHQRELRKQFSEAVGLQVLKAEPALEKPVRDFTARNVGLIKSLKGEVLERLKKELGAALDSGARAPELEKMLREQYGVAKRKAEFIARDQVGKLYASLTEERHRQLGITRYRWRTVKDNRVRRRHVKREGVIFEYAKPPHEDKTDGHAGTPPRCRCYQEPILDDVLPPAETVKREKETVDPAPPEAPRPPKSVVPTETVAQALERVRRAVRIQPGKAPPPEKPTRRAARMQPAKAPAAAVAKAAPARADPRVPVGREGRWSDTRVYRIPLEELADVPALVWQEGRAESIRKAYAEGKAKDLPPILVSTDKARGLRELDDGNHRLSVARERGEKFITVRFGDRKAADIIARPKNPGVPWFIRENPENFPHLVNPDGTLKEK